MLSFCCIISFSFLQQALIFWNILENFESASAHWALAQSFQLKFGKIVTWGWNCSVLLRTFSSWCRQYKTLKGKTAYWVIGYIGCIQMLALNILRRRTQSKIGNIEYKKSWRPSGPRLPAGGLSGLLTSSFAFFGRSSCVKLAATTMRMQKDDDDNPLLFCHFSLMNL